MLKGWFDRMLVCGEVYTSKKRFEHGRFAGKKAMLSVTVGTSEATYAHDGRSGDVDLLLWPVHFTLAYVGYTVLHPFLAYGVEAGLRYSDPATVEARLKRTAESWAARLARLEEVPVIPVQHHGALGPGRPHHPRGPGPFALHPPPTAAGTGMMSALVRRVPITTSSSSGRRPLARLAAAALAFGLSAASASAQQTGGFDPIGMARKALAEPFVGVTTDGTPQADLFAVAPTGISTAPVVEAARALLGALEPAQRAAIRFPADDVQPQPGGAGWTSTGMPKPHPSVDA